MALVVAVAVVVVAVVAVRALAGGSGSPSAHSGTAGGAATSGSGGAKESPSPKASASGASHPSAAAAATVITIGWVGDTTPGSMYGLAPDRGRALFGRLPTLLRKPDLMIANLEGTYSTPGPSKCAGSGGTCYAFQAPLSLRQGARWSGIDLVNMANNHSMDYLRRGYLQTQAA